MADLKTRVRKMFSLNKELIRSFELLAQSTRIPQSRLMDEAIEDLLKKYEKKGD